VKNLTNEIRIGKQKNLPVRAGFFLSHSENQKTFGESFLLSECVHFASQTGLFASCAVLVEHVVSSSHVNGLASSCEEGFRFINVSSLNSVENTTGSSAYTGLLSSVLRTALSVRFYTKNRCFNIRQVVHPPQLIRYLAILARPFLKSNTFILPRAIFLAGKGANRV
jgi:hypothetical protein